MQPRNACHGKGSHTVCLTVKKTTNILISMHSRVMQKSNYITLHVLFLTEITKFLQPTNLVSLTFFPVLASSLHSIVVT